MRVYARSCYTVELSVVLLTEITAIKSVWPNSGLCETVEEYTIFLQQKFRARLKVSATSLSLCTMNSMKKLSSIWGRVHGCCFQFMDYVIFYVFETVVLEIRGSIAARRLE